jgi:hypothetical protein
LALATFLVLNPYILVHPGDFLRWFLFQANVALRTHPHAPPPDAWLYGTLLREQGWPVLAACAAALPALACPRRPLGAMAAFGLLYLAAFSLMQTQYDRFVLPPIALLCATGASVLPALLRARAPRLNAAVVLLAAPLIVWPALRRPPALPPDFGPDNRAEMFAWIARHVPPDAAILIESDTMPLLQMIHDPGDPAGRRFQTALRAAFERRHPTFPRGIVKAQYIGAVYNYDPAHLRNPRAYFLASSRNRELIERERDRLPGPAAFYQALDRAALPVHEADGYRERLVLYATAGACEREALAAADGPRCAAH